MALAVPIRSIKSASAFAAEGRISAFLAKSSLFPQPVSPCRKTPIKLGGFSPCGNGESVNSRSFGACLRRECNARGASYRSVSPSERQHSSIRVNAECSDAVATAVAGEKKTPARVDAALSRIIAHRGCFTETPQCPVLFKAECCNGIVKTIGRIQKLSIPRNKNLRGKTRSRKTRR